MKVDISTTSLTSFSQQDGFIVGWRWSKKAFSQLREIMPSVVVDVSYADKYSKRDNCAREAMKDLIESERNTMRHGFTYVLDRRFQL